jgi:hypothetical protein
MNLIIVQSSIFILCFSILFNVVDIFGTIDCRLAILLLFANIFWTLGGFEAIFVIGCEYYYRLINLKKLVSTQYKTPIMIIYKSICLIFQLMYSNFLNYMNNMVQKKDAKTNIVKFVIGGKLFSLLISSKLGPEEILQIIDENDNDITNELLPFIRLQRNLMKITPEKLGYGNIQIITTKNDNPLDLDKKSDIIQVLAMS